MLNTVEENQEFDDAILDLDNKIIRLSDPLWALFNAGVPTGFVGRIDFGVFHISTNRELVDPNPELQVCGKGVFVWKTENETSWPNSRSLMNGLIHVHFFKTISKEQYNGVRWKDVKYWPDGGLTWLKKQQFHFQFNHGIDPIEAILAPKLYNVIMKIKPDCKDDILWLASGSQMELTNQQVKKLMNRATGETVLSDIIDCMDRVEQKT